MNTADLVRRLSSSASPVRSRTPQRAVWPALALATLASIGIGIVVAGLLPDLFRADRGIRSLARVALGLAFGSAGLGVLMPSLRPGHSSPWATRSMAAASLLLVGLFASGLSTATLADLIRALSVAGPVRSPLTITALAVPVLVALIVVLRKEAPTRLNLTGAAMGLISGGVGAAAFFLAGPNEPTTFLPIWYAAGIGVAMLCGMIAGPRFLRW